MIMTVLTGDFALDASLAGLPSGIGVPACDRPGHKDETAACDDAGDGDLRLYLRHVEQGESIRSLAREAGCHASTILRRIRRFEARRDDPLVDRAVERASGAEASGKPHPAPGRTGMRQISRILRRLAEPGAQMVVAEGMEKAIIVRDDIRTAILDRELAEHMAMRAWVQQIGQGRVSRYAISAQGREALRALLAARRGNAMPRGEDFANADPVLEAE